MQFYDKRGVPIYPGDLLKTFHFRGARWRKNYYLYHVAVKDDGYMKMYPVCWLEPSKQRNRGGPCLLSHEHAAETEVIQGYGPPPYLDYTDRPRRKQRNEAQHEEETA